MVSGCFDLLHSGHVAFLESAAEFGELYVSVGSDATVRALKGRAPVYGERERLYMVSSLGCVKEAFVASGSGVCDFSKEMKVLKPDVFVVNADGDCAEKRELCSGIRYEVLERVPADGLPARSTTSLRGWEGWPYRLSLAGSWIDQPWVSGVAPGAMVVVSIEPESWFERRCGLATSTREKIGEIWEHGVPVCHARAAEILFAVDNPVGTRYVSGSQDAIGLMYPGVSRLRYEGGYWPAEIESVVDEDRRRWLEETLSLVSFGPRAYGFNPLSRCRVRKDTVRRLGRAGEACWEAILGKDTQAFGAALSESFACSMEMFPSTVSPLILERVRAYQEYGGCMFTGAGGGGYLVVASDNPVHGSRRIRVRT